MHRPLVIVALVLLLAAVPLSAQHGGGHASGGGHGFGGGGFASHGSFGGHAGGGHAFSGMRSSPGSAGHSFTHGSTFNRPLSARGLNRGLNHSGVGVRIRTFGFRNNCLGFGCRGGFGYPWFGGAYDPYWWWDSGSSYDQDQQDQTGLANEMNRQNLDEQRMRQQGDQDLYAGSAPPPPREHREHEELNEAAPATVLVFRDEHKQEVHNYAIVGQTLFNFNPQHTQKIPLSDLDIPATTKENDERGVDFHVPGAPSGQ
jgi:hypothetical protein